MYILFRSVQPYSEGKQKIRDMYPFTLETKGTFCNSKTLIPAILYLTLLHSERPKLYTILVFLSAAGLKVPWQQTTNQIKILPVAMTTESLYLLDETLLTIKCLPIKVLHCIFSYIINFSLLPQQQSAKMADKILVFFCCFFCHQ